MLHIPCWRAIRVSLGYLVFNRGRGTGERAVWDWVGREAANKVAWGSGDPAGSSGIGFSLAVREKWSLHTTQRTVAHAICTCSFCGAIKWFHFKINLKIMNFEFIIQTRWSYKFLKAAPPSKHTGLDLSACPVMRKSRSDFYIRQALGRDQKGFLCSATNRTLQISAYKYPAFTMETFNYGKFNCGNFPPIILILKFSFPLIKKQIKFASAALFFCALYLMLTNATMWSERKRMVDLGQWVGKALWQMFAYHL